VVEAHPRPDFKNRILATRGFVLENLESAVRHKEQIEELCAAADRRVTEPNAAIYDGDRRIGGRAATGRQLGTEIGLDQVLSARVLKLVNSGFYGFSQPISTIPTP